MKDIVLPYNFIILILHHIIFFCKLYVANSIIYSVIETKLSLILFITIALVLEYLYTKTHIFLRREFIDTIGTNYAYNLSSILSKTVHDISNIKNLNILPDTIRLSENAIERLYLNFPKLIIYQCYYIYMIFTTSRTLFLITFIFTCCIIPLIKRQFEILKQNNNKIISIENTTRMKMLDTFANIQKIKSSNMEIQESNIIDTLYKNRQNIRFDISSSEIKYICEKNMLIMLFRGVILYFSLNKIANLTYLIMNCSSFVIHSYDLMEVYIEYSCYKSINEQLKFLNEIHSENPNEYEIQQNYLHYDLQIRYYNKEYKFSPLTINIIKGNNGVGCTQFIKTLLGYNFDEHMTINFFDRVTHYQNKIPTYYRHLLRKYIAYLPQNNAMIKGDGKMNMLYGSPLTNESINKILIDLNIAYWFNELCDKDVSKMSSSELKKIGIINTLLLNRRIIIMDDPTAHLDDNSVNTLIKILRQLKMDRTLIIMTNDLRLCAIGDSVKKFDFMNY